MRARDMRVGGSHPHPYHVDIQVGLLHFLECVWLPLHVHLGGE